MIELIVLGSIQLAVWGTIGIYRVSKNIRKRIRNRNNIDVSDCVEFYTSHPNRPIRINEQLPKYEPLDPMFYDSSDLPSYDSISQ